MKALLFVALLLLPCSSFAIKPQTVAKGSVTTSGIGGHADLGFAFAKGDLIHIQASSEKKLQSMMALLFPNIELAKASESEQPTLSFTMSKDGIIVFRFISDRSGDNLVHYTITRTPATASLSNYNTKVVWLKPANGAPGNLTPVRENSRYDKARVVQLIR